MATLLFWVSFFLSVATPLQGSSKGSIPQEEPSVDQILDNFERAVGGREAWSRFTSRVSTGTFTVLGSDLSGTFEIHEVGPSRLCSVEKFANGKEVRIAFDGRVGWTINPESGTRKLTGEELADVKRRAKFPEEVNVRAFFKELHLRGKASLGGRDTYVIEAVPQEGSPWTMYFDAKTWLRVRMDGTVHFASASEAAQGYFDDYREVGKLHVKYPFRTTLKTSHGTLVKRVEDVQLNVPVDPSLFTPPSFKFKIQR